MTYYGEYLFRYRGQLPLIIIIIAIPIIATTSYYNILPIEYQNIVQYCSILLSICGLFLRYYITGTTPEDTSGRNRKKQIANTLNTTGAYSIVRNPLYLANYLIWIGLASYSLSYILCIIISLLFIIYYERIIIVEEKFLSEKFKVKYDVFCQKTPICFPSFRNYQKSNYPFSIKNILRQEYSSTLSLIVTYIYIDVLLIIFHGNNITCNLVTWKHHIYIFLVSILITVLLKVIKTKSDLLDE